MTINNVTHKVLAHDLCVGCGICAGVCPAKCIQIDVSKKGDLQPHINGNCTDCAICLDVCPFFDHASSVTTVAEDMFAQQEGDQYQDILGHFQQCYIGYASASEKRFASASGGLLTEVLLELHRRGDIDAVAHVKTDRIANRYCGFVTSETPQQIQSCRGSAYYPTEVSDIIHEIMRSDRRWCIVALPCVAYGIRLAQMRLPKLQDKIKYVFALTCGTLPNDFFTEFLLSQADAANKPVKRVTYRAKLNRSRATDFFFEAYAEDNSLQGHAAELTGLALRLWNMGFFRTNACNYCEDVFGETADMSFMDAWLKPYNQDPAGHNIAVARNRELISIMEDLQQRSRIAVEKLEPDHARDSQKGARTKKYESVPIRLHWANRIGQWYPTRRQGARKGKWSDRISWAIQRRTQAASKFVWPLVGRRLGWRAFLVAMGPFYIARRFFDLSKRVSRITAKFNKR